jgi:hypothetical protein
MPCSNGLQEIKPARLTARYGALGAEALGLAPFK